jgi:hypothetical protein
MTYRVAKTIHTGVVLRGGGLPDQPLDNISEEVFNWTTTPPTVEGWYWVCTNKGVPHVVKVGLFGTGQTGNLWVYETGHSQAYDLDVYDYWLGPIPVPEPPKD